jgi:hypothetical protein
MYERVEQMLPGMGKDLGLEQLDHFPETKAVWIQL